MKEFEKLTDKEIIKLTDDQLEKYYKLEMANEGIPFLDKPTEPEYETKMLPDLILYSSTFLSIYFTDQSVVQEIINIVKNNKDKARLTDYDYNVGTQDYYEKKKLKRNSYDSNEMALEIIEKSVYSDVAYISIKDVNERNKKRSEKHEELGAKYNENEEKMNECRAKIYDK